MGDTGGIRAGHAYVEISARDKVSKRLIDIERRVKSLGDGVATVGTKFATIGIGAVGSLLVTAKSFATMGDQVAKASTRTGVAVESLSQLKYAAEQSGASLDALETSLKKQSKLIIDAAAGEAAATDTLNALGLSYRQLASVSPEEQFKTLSQAVSEIVDPTARAAAAMDVWGKSGTSLIPLIESGRSGIEKLQREAHRLGLTMSTKDAKAAEDFGDRLADLADVAKAAVFQVGAALSPTLREAAVSLTESASAAVKWINANRPLIQQWGALAIKVAAGAVALGGALLVIGKLISVGGSAIAIIRGMISAFGTLKLAMAFLAANPFLLLIAGAVAAVVVLNQLSSYVADVKTEMAGLREAHDAARAAELERLDRLNQLAAAEHLNAEEMAEAKGIIAQLEAVYGKLNITLDESAGRLYGVHGATKKILELQRQVAQFDLNKEIEERTENLKKLGDQKIARKNYNESFLDAVDKTLADRNIGPPEAAERLSKRANDTSDLDRQIKEELTRISLAKARIDALKGGDNSALTGDASSNASVRAATGFKAEAEAANKAADARQRLADLQEAERRSSLSGQARELAEINDRLQEQIKLIDELSRGAKARADAGDPRAAAEYSRLQGQRVDAARRAQMEIGRAVAEGERQTVEDVRAAVDQQTRLIEALQEVARRNGDAGGVAKLEQMRVAAVRSARQKINAIERADTDKRIAEVRAAQAEELRIVDQFAQDAAKRGDLEGYKRIEAQKVGIIQSAERQIAEIRSAAARRALDEQLAAAAAIAEQANRRIADTRGKAADQVQDIDVRQSQARDRGDITTVQALERQRVKVIADAEAEVKRLREQSMRDQIDALREAEQQQLQMIDKQAAAARAAGDTAAFVKAQQDRVAVVRTTEAQIAQVRQEAADRQAADNARRAAEERQRQKDLERQAQDRKSFELSLEEQLARKRGDKRSAKDVRKQIDAIEFEQRLDSVYGDDEKAKKRARDLKKQLDAMPDVSNSSAGIFNAAAIQSLQGSPAESRIAKATEETAKNTKELARKKGATFK